MTTSELLNRLPDPLGTAALFRMAALDQDQQLRALRYSYHFAHGRDAICRSQVGGIVTGRELARLVDAAEQLEVLGVFDPGRVRQDVCQWLNINAVPDIRGRTYWTRITERPRVNRSGKRCRVLEVQNVDIEGNTNA